MIDPTKTAERQYEAIAQIIEREGFVKDRIVSALSDVIAGEIDAVTPKVNVFQEFMASYLAFRDRIPAEHYTPVPWDAVTTAAKKGS